MTNLDLSVGNAEGKELCWSIVDRGDIKTCTTIEDFCEGPHCRFTTFDPKNDCCPIYSHTESWTSLLSK